MLFTKNKRKGFTLIELLVVVAIASLLFSIVLVTLNSARAQGRDAKRMEDLRQIKNALALYYHDNGHYPMYPQTGGPNNFFASCSPGIWTPLETALAPYIKTLPVDSINTLPCDGPWSSGHYTYAYRSDGFDKYDLIAALENTNSPYRCGLKKYLRHYDDGSPELIWCSGGMGYWDQMYADH